jgi:hypothetical protein
VTIFQSYRRQNPDGTFSPPFVGGWDILRNAQLGGSPC